MAWPCRRCSPTRPAARVGGGDFDWLSFVVQDIAVGLLTGLIVGLIAVFVSILAHGLTDTPGVNWLARRTEPIEPQPRT